jgi:hypothetical protein
VRVALDAAAGGEHPLRVGLSMEASWTSAAGRQDAGRCAAPPPRTVQTQVFDTQDDGAEAEVAA